MAEYVELPKGRRDVKFHAQFKDFRRVVKLTSGKNHYELRINKNDAVYEVYKCVVKTWKTIEKGKRKFTVPDVILRARETVLFNKLLGQPSKLAMERAQNYLDDIQSRASVAG